MNNTVPRIETVIMQVILQSHKLWGEMEKTQKGVLGRSIAKKGNCMRDVGCVDKVRK